MLQMRVTGGFMPISNIYRGSLFGGEMGRNVLERETKFPIHFNLFADCISPPFHPTTLVNSDGRLPSNKSCSMLTTVSAPLLFCQRQKDSVPVPLLQTTTTPSAVRRPSTSLRNIDQACPTFIDTINYLAVSRPSSQAARLLTHRKQPSVLPPLTHTRNTASLHHVESRTVPRGILPPQ